MRSYRKDLTKLAREQGWSIERTRGNHLRLTHPKAKGFVIAPLTPSDWRAFKTMRAYMRRVLKTA